MSSPIHIPKQGADVIEEDDPVVLEAYWFNLRQQKGKAAPDLTFRSTTWLKEQIVKDGGKVPMRPQPVIESAFPRDEYGYIQLG